MLDRTAAAKSKPSLNGMVFCARCGSEMADTGRRYYCPNSTVEAGGSCNVRPADAQGLLSSVVTRMINRLATEETVQRVTETIREMTGADLHRMKMENYDRFAYDSGEALPSPRDTEDYEQAPPKHGAHDAPQASGQYKNLQRHGDPDKLRGTAARR